LTPVGLDRGHDEHALADDVLGVVTWEDIVEHSNRSRQLLPRRDRQRT
jgi:hypothetical protein